MRWWKRFARRVALESIQDEFRERHPLPVSQEDLGRLAMFITECALDGAEAAQGLATALRETYLANEREGLQKLAPQYVKHHLTLLENVPWLGQGFAQDLGEIAFEGGFEQWCENVLDYPKPLQH